MKEFFWSSGHIGWGVFAAVVFTVLWLVVSDCIWRIKTVGFGRFATILSAGWAVGIVLIVLVFCVGSH
jgi:hypothetical protein